MVQPGGEAHAAVSGDVAAIETADACLRRTLERGGREGDAADAAADADAVTKTKTKSSSFEKTPGRQLQSRAAYVCRRAFCAKRATKEKAFVRGLACADGASKPFADALIALCVAAEASDGVDSGAWAYRRPPGIPSRWTTHPGFVDATTGEMAADAVEKRGLVRKAARTGRKGLG